MCGGGGQSKPTLQERDNAYLAGIKSPTSNWWSAIDQRAQSGEKIGQIWYDSTDDAYKKSVSAETANLYARSKGYGLGTAWEQNFRYMQSDKEIKNKYDGMAWAMQQSQLNQIKQQQEKYQSDLDYYNQAQAEIYRRDEPNRIAKERQDILAQDQAARTAAQQQAIEAAQQAQANRDRLVAENTERTKRLATEQAERMRVIETQRQANAAANEAVSRSMDVLGTAAGSGPKAQASKRIRGGNTRTAASTSLSIPDARQTPGAGPNIST